MSAIESCIQELRKKWKWPQVTELIREEVVKDGCWLCKAPCRMGLPGYGGLRGHPLHGAPQGVEGGWAKGSHGKIGLKVQFGKGAKSQITKSFLCLSGKHCSYCWWQALQDLTPMNMERFVFLKDNSKETRALNQQVGDETIAVNFARDSGIVSTRAKHGGAETGVES